MKFIPSRRYFAGSKRSLVAAVAEVYDLPVNRVFRWMRNGEWEYRMERLALERLLEMRATGLKRKENKPKDGLQLL